MITMSDTSYTKLTGLLFFSDKASIARHGDLALQIGLIWYYTKLTGLLFFFDKASIARHQIKKSKV